MRRDPTSRGHIEIWSEYGIPTDSRTILKTINLAYQSLISDLTDEEPSTAATGEEFEESLPGILIMDTDPSKVVFVSTSATLLPGLDLWSTDSNFRIETSNICRKRLVTLNETPSIRDINGNRYAGVRTIKDRVITLDPDKADFATPWFILGIIRIRDVMISGKVAGYQGTCSKALAQCGLHSFTSAQSQGYLEAERQLAQAIAKFTVERVLKQGNRTGLFGWCGDVARNFRPKNSQSAGIEDYASVLSAGLIWDQPDSSR